MERKICAYLFGITFIALSTVVHGQGDTAPSPQIDRSPSIESVAEVDIEDAKAAPGNPGYNFAEGERAPAKARERVPANIVTKESTESHTSFVGPIIFLIALPIGLWIVVSKKLASRSEEKRVDYFPKTHQFQPYTTDYQKTAEDDDVDFPKAS